MFDFQFDGVWFIICDWNPTPLVNLVKINKKCNVIVLAPNNNNNKLVCLYLYGFVLKSGHFFSPFLGWLIYNCMLYVKSLNNHLYILRDFRQ